MLSGAAPLWMSMTTRATRAYDFPVPGAPRIRPGAPAALAASRWKRSKLSPGVVMRVPPSDIYHGHHAADGSAAHSRLGSQYVLSGSFCSPSTSMIVTNRTFAFCLYLFTGVLYRELLYVTVCINWLGAGYTRLNGLPTWRQCRRSEGIERVGGSENIGHLQGQCYRESTHRLVQYADR